MSDPASAANESAIVLPVDSVGKASRTEAVATTFAGGSDGYVHMPVEVVGDPINPNNLLSINADGSLPVSAEGLMVLMRSMLRELKGIRLAISAIADNEALEDYTDEDDG
jgi:hypothetical protein